MISASRLRFLTLSSAILISVVLCTAAIGKLLAPSGEWRFFDRYVAIFEILWIVVLLRFHLYWQMWLFSSIIFLSWAGFSLYWLVHDLPCSCFGKALDLPNGFSFACDLVFLGVSIVCALGLGAKKKMIAYASVAGIVLAAGGYLLAKLIIRLAFPD